MLNQYYVNITISDFIWVSNPQNETAWNKILAKDGRMRKTDCANAKIMFRLIQSIPSKKAEPFKQWFAQVAHERIQEIENPELAAQRAREYYKALGYNDEWLVKELQRVKKEIEKNGIYLKNWNIKAILQAKQEALFSFFGYSTKKVKDKPIW